MSEDFPYQVIGSDFLASVGAGRKRLLLLDAPGLGKTRQAIRGADKLGVDSMDVVSPAAVTTQWRKNHEKDAWYDRKFTSRSYESARDKGLPRKGELLIFDEFHYLKNELSQRTRALFGQETFGRDGMIDGYDTIWAMSGTPAPKNAYDLFPVMRALIPHSLKLPNGHIMDNWQFIKKFCKGFDNGREFQITGNQNEAELSERLAPYSIRRTKKDVLPDWKEPVVDNLWLDPGKARDMLMKAELEPEGIEIAQAFAQGGFEALAILAKTNEKGVSRLRRYTGILKVLPIVEWLLAEFDSGLEKIVVICVHREVIDGIYTKLKEHKIDSVIYWGGMTDAQKEKAKSDFIQKEKIRAIIGQIVAMGTGTDGIQHATGRMLFAEWSWIDDDNYQAICRLDRIGQEEPVIGQFAGLEGSLDGAIMAAASRRAAEQRTLFGR